MFASQRAGAATRCVEQKYQEQLKGLQQEVDCEREQLLHHATRQRQTLELEVRKLKEEEFLLRDRLAQTQKVSEANP